MYFTHKKLIILLISLNYSTFIFVNGLLQLSMKPKDFKKKQVKNSYYKQFKPFITNLLPTSNGSYYFFHSLHSIIMVHMILHILTNHNSNSNLNFNPKMISTHFICVFQETQFQLQSKPISYMKLISILRMLNPNRNRRKRH